MKANRGGGAEASQWKGGMWGGWSLLLVPWVSFWQGQQHHHPYPSWQLNARESPHCSMAASSVLSASSAQQSAFKATNHRNWFWSFFGWWKSLFEMSVLTPGEINTLLHRNGTVLWKGCGTLIAIFGIYCAKFVFFLCSLSHYHFTISIFRIIWDLLDVLLWAAVDLQCLQSRFFLLNFNKENLLAIFCCQHLHPVLWPRHRQGCMWDTRLYTVDIFLMTKIKRTDLSMQKWGSCGSNDISFSPEHTWHMCYVKSLKENFFALYNNTASHVALPLHFFLHFRFLPYCFQSPMTNVDCYSE